MAIIEHRQAELDQIYTRYADAPQQPVDDVDVKSDHSEWTQSDKDLCAKIAASNQGPKFCALFDKKLDGYGSQSEADLALCSILAFWTAQDGKQIDRIFRKSGLYRPKWDRKHGQFTYGQMTIQKANAGAKGPAPVNRQVIPVNLFDFLAREFPPRTNLLGAWLPSQGLTMVYAYRGIGKTHFALGVAYAVASGGEYLGWQAPAPVGCMYIDGEMPGPVMQERLASIVKSSNQLPVAPFVLLTPDLQPEGMPRIDTTEGQAAIESVLTDEIKLIVIDNISTLTGAKENEADGWTPVQEWALKQRSTGRSVLFVHHSGKGGAQRGTSRREDVLDTVIALRRPVDYQPDQGAVFEIHFEKARGLYGDDVKPIEATLRVDDSGIMTWLTRTVEECTFDRVVELLNDGISQKEIALELNIHKSNVSRHAKKAAAAGLVKQGKKRTGSLFEAEGDGER